MKVKVWHRFAHNEQRSVSWYKKMRSGYGRFLASLTPFLSPHITSFGGTLGTWLLAMLLVDGLRELLKGNLSRILRHGKPSFSPLTAHSPTCALKHWNIPIHCSISGTKVLKPSLQFFLYPCKPLPLCPSLWPIFSVLLQICLQVIFVESLTPSLRRTSRRESETADNATLEVPLSI